MYWPSTPNLTNLEREGPRLEMNEGPIDRNRCVASYNAFPGDVKDQRTTRQLAVVLDNIRLGMSHLGIVWHNEQITFL